MSAVLRPLKASHTQLVACLIAFALWVPASLSYPSYFAEQYAEECDSQPELGGYYGSHGSLDDLGVGSDE
jgi:hypothetical protein